MLPLHSVPTDVALWSKSSPSQFLLIHGCWDLVPCQLQNYSGKSVTGTGLHLFFRWPKSSSHSSDCSAFPSRLCGPACHMVSFSIEGETVSISICQSVECHVFRCLIFTNRTPGTQKMVKCYPVPCQPLLVIWLREKKGFSSPSSGHEAFDQRSFA